MERARCLRTGMVGTGMIFDETYRPFFEAVRPCGLYDRRYGVVDVQLVAVASRTGHRAEAYRRSAAGQIADFQSYSEPDSVQQLLRGNVDVVCVATPDDRHFEAARRVLESGKHVLIEKPSVLSLHELDRIAAVGRIAACPGQSRLP